eukprot:scaffold58480_cov27-Tisochrysis_lutea.AAC.4
MHTNPLSDQMFVLPYPIGPPNIQTWRWVATTDVGIKRLPGSWMGLSSGLWGAWEGNLHRAHFSPSHKKIALLPRNDEEWTERQRLLD